MTNSYVYEHRGKYEVYLCRCEDRFQESANYMFCTIRREIRWHQACQPNLRHSRQMIQPNSGYHGGMTKR